MKYHTLLVMRLLLLSLSIFTLSCEKEDPQGCCYYRLASPGTGFNYSWSCIDNAIESSCEDIGDEDTTIVDYFREDVECSNVQYCTEGACEAIGCEWFESDFGGSALCMCN